ncbi:MAG TPA: hypothetical protein VGZ73_30900, partial [Bryobacteraceae bacterium]|nr:hypothetical protein [Bryobacteraceae bacterium]
LSLAPRGLAQNLSIGLTGGANLTQDFRSTSFPATFYGSTFAFSDSRSLIAGPSLEAGLARGFSVEVNALHRSLHFTDVTLQSDGSKANPVDFAVGTWEFPVLMKYRVSGLRVQPFLEAGPSFRAVSDPHGSSPSNHGITMGAGATMHVGAIKIAPVLRYTRWAQDQFKPGQTGGFNSPPRPTIANQLELLMNLSYGSTERSRRALGRKLWIGVVAGAGLTGDFRAGGPTSFFGGPGGAFTAVSVDRSGVRSYPAGLQLEIEFTDHLSLEGNGLYRRLHFKGLSDVVLTWEVPLLLKYRHATHHVTPFLAAGPSFRAAGNLNSANPSHYGVAAEAGVEKVLGKVRVEPGLRYTHWALDSTPTPQFPNNSFSRTVPNQVEALLGVSF